MGFVGISVVSAKGKWIIKDYYSVCMLTTADLGVRGTMPTHFEKRYGKGTLEMVQVKDMEREGCFDAAVRGCSGVIHVASVTAFSTDPHKIINPSITFVQNILAAAEKEPSVSRFVLTSSSAAASQDRVNEAYDLTPDMWANWAIEEAWASTPHTEQKARANYYASKALSEQRMWKYVEERNPRFVVNSVLPDFVIGLAVKPEQQGFASSMALFKQMFENSGDAWRSFGPQWCVDAYDVALLHIAGLVCPHAKNERIFAYAHRKTWTEFIRRLQESYPNHQFPGVYTNVSQSEFSGDYLLIRTSEPDSHEGQDLSNVTGRERAEGLLRWMGSSGWKPLGESLKEVSDYILLN
ncbi:hypothetical protein PTNB85_08911 [Pyrenophora teres f. teres]|nr:hypothetical protein HRS9139_10245 [Pyrenophora teres f. teres]KAE8825966.1 hypothetical protein PTNB85_08911 [Pyrenophora teres f. teres]